MSLFGDSPPRQKPQDKSNLFDESSSNKNAGSGLFADQETYNGDSTPWDMPTPRKNAKRTLIRTIIGEDDVPELYDRAFNVLIQRDESTDGTVSADTVRRFLAEDCNIQQSQANVIFNIINTGQSPRFIKAEINVLLALVGLAQEEGEDVNLDSVQERRKTLPTPRLSNIKSSVPQIIQHSPDKQFPSGESGVGYNNTPAKRPPQPSFGSFEADPWSSPALHKGHNHTLRDEAIITNGHPTSSHNPINIPSRTTSSFTTSAALNDRPIETSNGSMPIDGPGWNIEAVSEVVTRSSLSGPDHHQNSIPKSIGSGKRTGSAIEEEISIHLLEEKEGMFLFQHRNYELVSSRKNSKVIRRYSDFVWLLDCLHKRYPFRQLPLLPPKRVSTADTLFLEKRRRGLVRFSNALIRHPVLGQEQLVVMFLTVPTELAVWRKQATISVQEEFNGKTLSPGLEESLPSTLPQLFDTVRLGVQKAVECYINLCNMLEKLIKLKLAIAAENMRISVAMGEVAETSQDSYAYDTNEVPLLNTGLQAVSKHLSANRTRLEDESKTWDIGVLEDFKKQRDCLVSLRDMFDRRDRLAKDNIPQLERKIESNQAKLVSLRAKLGNGAKPSEIEKIEESIVKDKQSIIDQHARGVFIKECIRDELRHFNKSQYSISHTQQDWAHENVKYAEAAVENWRRLADDIENMPTG